MKQNIGGLQFRDKTYRPIHRSNRQNTPVDNKSSNKDRPILSKIKNGIRVVTSLLTDQNIETSSNDSKKQKV